MVNCQDCEFAKRYDLKNARKGLYFCVNKEVPRKIVKQFETCSKGELRIEKGGAFISGSKY